MMGSTMFHLYGGDAAKSRDGSISVGGAAVDHIALTARKPVRPVFVSTCAI